MLKFLFIQLFEDRPDAKPRARRQGQDWSLTLRDRSSVSSERRPLEDAVRVGGGDNRVGGKAPRSAEPASQPAGELLRCDSVDILLPAAPRLASATAGGTAPQRRCASRTR